VRGFAVNFSSILRMAPPPFGKLKLDGWKDPRFSELFPLPDLDP